MLLVQFFCRKRDYKIMFTLRAARTTGHAKSAASTFPLSRWTTLRCWATCDQCAFRPTTRPHRSVTHRPDGLWTRCAHCSAALAEPRWSLAHWRLAARLLFGAKSGWANRSMWDSTNIRDSIHRCVRFNWQCIDLYLKEEINFNHNILLHYVGIWCLIEFNNNIIQQDSKCVNLLYSMGQ